MEKYKILKKMEYFGENWRKNRTFLRKMDIKKMNNWIPKSLHN